MTMKSLLWILALFALAVGVSLVMHVNEGYVLLVLPPYRTEVSLNLAVLVAMLAFGALYAVLRAVALASALPRQMREAHARRKHEKATKIFSEGLRLYLAGERRRAIDALTDLRGEGDWGVLAASLSARAADEVRDQESEGQGSEGQALLAKD
jgi:HemY protein